MSNFGFDASHLEKKHAIYSLISDMCISMWGHQRRIISHKKKYDEKTEKETKVTRFPAPGFEPWPRTAKWCGQMLYTLSCVELVNIAGWILKSCFRCPTYCKDQALKHMRYSIGRKESPLQWFAIDPISKKKPSPLKLAVSYKKHLSPFIL